MPTMLTEGQLTFEFPDGWQVSKFDEWSFYKNQFMGIAEAVMWCSKCDRELRCAQCGSRRVAGTRGVDFLAVQPRKCLWSIEVKDFANYPRTKSVDLADEVALKVRDTLATLVAAPANANDAGEKAMAAAALRCPRIRVVLHLEQARGGARIFTRPVDPANVQQRLKKLIKSIDPHPLVIKIGVHVGVGWSTKRVVI